MSSLLQSDSAISPNEQSRRPSASKGSSTDSGYHSPKRHHHRASSVQRVVKETSNAHSEYTNSQDDGTSQLRINQYLIRQEIGRGSFGAVHLAVDQYDNEYAVKEFSKTRLRRRAKSHLLRRPRTSRPGEADAAQRGAHSSPARRAQAGAQEETSNNAFDLIKEEIAVMKKLNHPNLVSLIEVLDDPEDDSLFMVLEMCKKGVIMKIEVEEDVDPYEEEDCRTWFRDMILGIEYLHAQGIVHRDIKPDNCLITDDDTLKIVDFGVSEMFEKAEDMRVARTAGSPAFQAPELCVVKDGNVSGKPADIWSMGVTLYCLYYGRVPFRQHAVLEMYKAIVNEEVGIPEGTNSQFADLMRRLLDKNPETRITMERIREHPWVTKDGADTLLSTEENCAEILSPPTDSEMNAAITHNMGRVFAVIKAAKRFKSLIEKRRPDLVDSILGQASRIVKPPLSMLRSGSHPSGKAPRLTSISTSDVHEARKVLIDDGDMTSAELADRIDQLPDRLRSAIIAAEDDSPALPDSPEVIRRVQTDPIHGVRPRRGKGQAHNVLEDYHYLNIGRGPEAGDDAQNGAGFVCESPTNVEFNVYEKAYEKEVEHIQENRGKRATVYLTRRVEKKWDKIAASANDVGPAPSLKDTTISGFASIVGKAIDSTRPSQPEHDKE